jgi:hypothetical protein
MRSMMAGIFPSSSAADLEVPDVDRVPDSRNAHRRLSM